MVLRGTPSGLGTGQLENWPDAAYGGRVQVSMSTEAAALISADGGKLWVWAAYPRMCCAGAPAWMHAATTPPAGLAGFTAVGAETLPAGVTMYFRATAGQCPDVLEIAIEGRRRPKVAAYWDGCLMAMV